MMEVLEKNKLNRSTHHENTTANIDDIPPVYVAGYLALYGKDEEDDLSVSREDVQAAIPTPVPLPINIDHRNDCTIGAVLTIVDDDAGPFFIGKIHCIGLSKILTGAASEELFGCVGKDLTDAEKNLYLIANYLPSASLSSRRLAPGEKADNTYFAHVALCLLGKRVGTVVAYDSTPEGAMRPFRRLTREIKNVALRDAINHERDLTEVTWEPNIESLGRALLGTAVNNMLLKDRWRLVSQRRRQAGIEGHKYLQASIITEFSQPPRGAISRVFESMGAHPQTYTPHFETTNVSSPPMSLVRSRETVDEIATGEGIQIAVPQSSGFICSSNKPSFSTEKHRPETYLSRTISVPNERDINETHGGMSSVVSSTPQGVPVNNSNVVHNRNSEETSATDCYRKNRICEDNDRKRFDPLEGFLWVPADCYNRLVMNQATSKKTESNTVQPADSGATSTADVTTQPLHSPAGGVVIPLPRYDLSSAVSGSTDPSFYTMSIPFGTTGTCGVYGTGPVYMPPSLTQSTVTHARPSSTSTHQSAFHPVAPTAQHTTACFSPLPGQLGFFPMATGPATINGQASTPSPLYFSHGGIGPITYPYGYIQAPNLTNGMGVYGSHTGLEAKLDTLIDAIAEERRLSTDSMRPQHSGRYVGNRSQGRFDSYGPSSLFDLDRNDRPPSNCRQSAIRGRDMTRKRTHDQEEMHYEDEMSRSSPCYPGEDKPRISYGGGWQFRDGREPEYDRTSQSYGKIGRRQVYPTGTFLDTADRNSDGRGLIESPEKLTGDAINGLVGAVTSLQKEIETLRKDNITAGHKNVTNVAQDSGNQMHIDDGKSEPSEDQFASMTVAEHNVRADQCNGQQTQLVPVPVQVRSTSTGSTVPRKNRSKATGQPVTSEVREPVLDGIRDTVDASAVCKVGKTHTDPGADMFVEQMMNRR